MSAYEGRNPAALRSQALMMDALDGLMREKGFQEITVSDICRRAGVSRQTFYSLFGTKEGILLRRLEASTDGQRHRDDGGAGITLKESCARFAVYVEENYGLLRMLADNGLMGVMEDQVRRAMESCRLSYVNVDDEERAYASGFAAAGLRALAQRYVSEHEIPDKAEIAKLAYKLQSGSVFRG